jgi:hypothetical protein
MPIITKYKYIVTYSSQTDYPNWGIFETLEEAQEHVQKVKAYGGEDCYRIFQALEMPKTKIKKVCL